MPASAGIVDQLLAAALLVEDPVAAIMTFYNAPRSKLGLTLALAADVNHHSHSEKLGTNSQK